MQRAEQLYLPTTESLSVGTDQAECGAAHPGGSLLCITSRASGGPTTKTTRTTRTTRNDGDDCNLPSADPRTTTTSGCATETRMVAPEKDARDCWPCGHCSALVPCGCLLAQKAPPALDMGYCNGAILPARGQINDGLHLVNNVLRNFQKSAGRPRTSAVDVSLRLRDCSARHCVAIQ